MHFRSLTSLSFALATGILISASLAKADQLCGHSFESLRELYAEIHDAKGGSIHRVYIDRADVHIVVAEDAMWVFTQDSHPASPAALCLSLVQATPSGAPEIQYRCGGGKPACEAFVAKFSSDDWRPKR
jgi:hypothetical protein